MLARVKLKEIDGGPHKRWSMWFNSMQREEPYRGLTFCAFLGNEKVQTHKQVVHGCRQLVSWDVRLSPVTSATLIASCLKKETSETASYKLEEGEDDVKSACPLNPGLHTCYNGWDKKKLTRESTQTLKTQSQFGLEAATRLHEAGIASNRRSAILRWIRSRALYTPPVTSWESATLEVG